MPPARKPTRPDPTLAALYQAVLASPDDDLPRLVYADYLDEHGDPARAEFIRLQCYVAATNPWDEGHADALVRSEVLYERHQEAWGVPDLERELVRPEGVYPSGFNFNPFVRGFPEVTGAVIDAFTAAHRKALKNHPIRTLYLVGGHTRAVRRVGEFINEVGAPTVDLSSAWGDVFAALAGGPPLPTVRKLALHSEHQDTPSPEALAEFAASRNFPNVEVVELGGLNETRMTDFVRRLRWPKLTDVNLSGRFDVGVIDAFAGAEWLAGVTRLSLTNFQYDDPPDLAPLFRSPHLVGLRQLELFAFNLSAEAVRAFAAGVGPLDRFRLDESGVSADDCRKLLDSPPLAGVQSLECPGSSVSVAEMAVALGRNDRLRQLHLRYSGQAAMLLANLPASRSLRRLRVQQFDLNDSGVKSLVSVPWPALSEFAIAGGRHDGQEVGKLIDHPHFTRLRVLDAGSLNGGTRAADVWKALAKSKTVGRFHKLRLGFPITDEQLNALLDNPEVCKIGHLALPNRVKIDRKTQRRYEKVFGVRITRDY